MSHIHENSCLLSLIIIISYKPAQVKQSSCFTQSFLLLHSIFDNSVVMQGIVQDIIQGSSLHPKNISFLSFGMLVFASTVCVCAHAVTEWKKGLHRFCVAWVCVCVQGCTGEMVTGGIAQGGCRRGVLYQGCCTGDVGMCCMVSQRNTTVVPTVQLCPVVMPGAHCCLPLPPDNIQCPVPISAHCSPTPTACRAVPSGHLCPCPCIFLKFYSCKVGTFCQFQL